MNRNYKIEGCFCNSRFAFIHIYKNASISVRNALDIRGKYFKWEDIKNKKLITLCVIRNPYNRIISSYQYLFRLEDNGLPDQHPIEETKNMEFFKKRDFNLFLDVLEGDNFFDAVTLPQNQFLLDRGLTINDIDEILIHENINKDFKRFSDKYNLNQHIPHDNIGFDKESRILKELIINDIKIRNKIENLYMKDIEMYNNLIKRYEF